MYYSSKFAISWVEIMLFGSPYCLACGFLML
jgi:hypothetical protein